MDEASRSSGSVPAGQLEKGDIVLWRGSRWKVLSKYMSSVASTAMTLGQVDPPHGNDVWVGSPKAPWTVKR